MPEQVPRKPGRPYNANPGAHAPPVALLLLALALVAVPALALFDALINHAASIPEQLLRTDRGVFLLRSLAVAALIALLATAAALPIARVLLARTTRARIILSALLITPVWLPPFMIYAAGNLLRAPDTAVGRAVINLATSDPDLRWVTIWLGYAVAIVGLALWSAPLGAVLIAAGLGHRSAIYDDMLALEPLNPIGRALFRLRMHRAVLIRSFTLIAIVMLGSAVPLHLAQLDTWSIVIWRQLTEHPPSQWGRVWISALPMLLIAALGARIITAYLSGANAHAETGTRRPDLPRSAAIAALLIFIVAALLPLLALGYSLNDPRSIAAFWRMNAGAVRDTAITAGEVALTTTAIALATSFALGSPVRAHRRCARAALMILCVLGLTPGILIGAGIARHGVLTLDLPAIAPYWASLTRYAFVGAIIGALAAASESPDRRSARIQIAGPSPLAWSITTLPSFLAPILATLPIAFLFAMFEIEAAVMVTPPGIDNLPQRLLSDLHFARLENLSAAGVNLLSIGIIIAFLASWLIIRATRNPNQSN